MNGMNIPFHKPYITDEEINAVVDTLKGGWLTMGPKTVKFEEAFKKYVGCGHAVAFNSCTAALHLALDAIGLKERDEVIIPAITFAATAEVVCYFKARPIFADVERDTHNMDVSRIEQKITSKTKAIIPVHYGGQPCDMDEIMQIAKKHNLYVIEDAAHALPSFYKDKKIGTISNITCFSFYTTKPLTTGEGGMATTENEDWAEKMRVMRLHGISSDTWKRHSQEGFWYYEVIMQGYKYNMTDIQAALGMEQLKKLEFMSEKRKKIAQRYNKAFAGIEEIIIPFVKEDRVTSWHLYPIKLRVGGLRVDRNKFIEELRKRGVFTGVHFIPLYRFPFYKNNFDYKLSDFPNCEWIYERVISLPIYPGMRDEEIDYVIENMVTLIKTLKR
ncbi:MAG: UDP-4-amino-4,6-dideoxy-N-acetyl-beta-L-altrosamine transaminase [Syntrophobacter sp. DG_60]|nr:MAG: UDP-4-amino-4,6-dideoxy-N-acetyl-beta-L-altrosamine transaminase [Syntrophobacter sp. DG_60]